jgi:hypothetical protein
MRIIGCDLDVRQPPQDRFTSGLPVSLSRCFFSWIFRKAFSEPRAIIRRSAHTFRVCCEHPFGVTPDRRYLYLSPTHSEARASVIVSLTHEAIPCIQRGSLSAVKSVLTNRDGCKRYPLRVRT